MSARAHSGDDALAVRAADEIEERLDAGLDGRRGVDQIQLSPDRIRAGRDVFLARLDTLDREHLDLWLRERSAVDRDDADHVTPGADGREHLFRVVELGDVLPVGGLRVEEVRVEVRADRRVRVARHDEDAAGWSAHRGPIGDRPGVDVSYLSAGQPRDRIARADDHSGPAHADRKESHAFAHARLWLHAARSEVAP